jgi:hypothetical protein
MSDGMAQRWCRLRRMLTSAMLWYLADVPAASTSSSASDRSASTGDAKRTHARLDRVASTTWPAGHGTTESVMLIDSDQHEKSSVAPSLADTIYIACGTCDFGGRDAAVRPSGLARRCNRGETGKVTVVPRHALKAAMAARLLSRHSPCNLRSIPPVVVVLVVVVAAGSSHGTGR